MKKIWKRVLIIAIVCYASLHIIGLFVFGITYGKYYSYLEKRPDAQENTTWVSEDGNILIQVEDFCNKTIYFKENGSVMESYFTSSRDYYINVYSIEALTNNRLDLYPEEHYERWAYTKVKKDSFTVKVEKTKFLEKGETITFYKTVTTQGDGSSVLAKKSKV